MRSLWVLSGLAAVLSVVALVLSAIALITIVSEGDEGEENQSYIVDRGEFAFELVLEALELYENEGRDEAVRYYNTPESTDGVIVLVDLVEGESGDIEVDEISAVPTWVDRRTFTIVDVGAALSAGTSSELTGQLEQSWARTTTTLRSYGVDVMFESRP